MRALCRPLKIPPWLQNSQHTCVDISVQIFKLLVMTHRFDLHSDSWSVPGIRSSWKKWSLQNCSLCYWLSNLSLHKRIIFYYAYIANKFQLLIGLENSRDQCFKTKISSTKTTEFRSRDQDPGLEDHKTRYGTSIMWPPVGRATQLSSSMLQA